MHDRGSSLMSYKRLLLDNDATLILPLYNDGYLYSDITTEKFYQERYIKTVLRAIEIKILNCLNGTGGERAVKYNFSIRSIKTTVIPQEENIFDTTLTKVQVVLDFSKTLNVEHIKDVEVIVDSVLFKNKDLATSLKVLIGGKVVKIEPAVALLTLAKKDKHYMSQFGEWSEYIITSKDVYHAIQKNLSSETNKAHTVVTSNITDIVNLVDLATFEAFGRVKSLPAIVKTSLSTQ